MTTSDNSEAITHKLATLVGFATETMDRMSNTQCLQAIADHFEAHKLPGHIQPLQGHAAFFASTQKSKKPKVLLAAHIDVVPANQAAYTLVAKDERLYGRGVFDMKFAVACYMQLVEDLSEALESYDFGIMLTSDEEIGGDSVARLLDAGYAADVCILPDGGNDWQLETSNNGAWFIKLRATGAPAHGSRPWEGQNAIDQLSHAIHEIRAIFGKLDPERCSITVSQIEGGTAVNQVPAHASAILDMRFRTLESYQKKRSKIEQIVKELGVAMETVAQVDPGMVDLDDPYIASFVEIAESVAGRPLGHCHSLGSSDAHHFVERGIPTILMRPTGGNAHGDHEWINAYEFAEFYEVLKAYVMKIARIA